MTAPTIAEPTTDYGFLVITLREALADMKVQAPEAVGRLDRAASLLVTRGIRPAPLGGWLVESERHAGEFYWVSSGATCCCNCKDYERHLTSGQPRKHILAERLLLAALEYEGPEPPAPLTFPVRPDYGDDEPIPCELTPLALGLLGQLAA